jgi:hypothetical protein
MPVFREIMGLVYAKKLAGPPPQFPRSIEDGIDSYLRGPPPPHIEPGDEMPPDPEVDENFLSLLRVPK